MRVDQSGIPGCEIWKGGKLTGNRDGCHRDRCDREEIEGLFATHGSDRESAIKIASPVNTLSRPFVRDDLNNEGVGQMHYAYFNSFHKFPYILPRFRGHRRDHLHDRSLRIIEGGRPSYARLRRERCDYTFSRQRTITSWTESIRVSKPPGKAAPGGDPPLVTRFINDPVDEPRLPTPGFDPIEDFEKVLSRASKPVELRNDEGVTFADEIERRVSGAREPLRDVGKVGFVELAGPPPAGVTVY
jgi:hypothetical protein